MVAFQESLIKILAVTFAGTLHASVDGDGRWRRPLDSGTHCADSIPTVGAAAQYI